MSERDRRSHGAMVITAPSEYERVYDLAVRLSRDELIALQGYDLHPWVRVKAHLDTETVELGAGVTAKRMLP